MNWIDSGCDYSSGIKIYDTYGDNNVLKGLFSKHSTRYYQDKLYSELINIKVSSEKNQIHELIRIKPDEIPIESMPEKLQKLEREKSRLFIKILKDRRKMKELLKIKTNGRISMGDALDLMAETDRYGRLKPFSLTYISFNKRTGKGGEVISFKSCYLRVVNNTGSKVRKGKINPQSHQPDHWKNSTRNFEPIGSGVIRKFHIWLLMEFNGMEVVTSDIG